MARPTFTAKFPLVARAKNFELRLSRGVDKVNPIYGFHREGKVVTFGPNVDVDEDEYFADMLEIVGYIGSDEDRKATLNGVKAPGGY